MLFYWLALAFRRLKWLLVMPRPKDVARIRGDLPCPVCGARDNHLHAVERNVQAGEAGQANMQVLCQHTCQICGARWFEAPVATLQRGMVLPIGEVSAPKKEINERSIFVA